MTFALILLLGVAAGTLTGAAGVGGILLVPLLLATTEASLQTAITSTLASYIASGTTLLIIHTCLSRRQRRAGRPTSPQRAGVLAPAFVAAGIGAAAGTAIVSVVPGRALSIALHVFVTVATVAALVQLLRAWHSQRHPTRRYCVPRERGTRQGRHRVRIRRRYRSHRKAPVPLREEPEVFVPALSTIAGIFVVTGCVSALTGSSGPVSCLPLMLAAGWPSTYALALAHVIQVPIAVVATISAAIVLPAALDGMLILALSLGQAAGVGIGVALGTGIPVTKLKPFLVALLLLVSLALLGRLILSE